MKKEDTLFIVKDLEFDKRLDVFSFEGIIIYITRPSKLSKNFLEKGYDPKKNFQIWMIDGQREFRPNHLRVFIDLNLRVRCKPEHKRDLLLAFDSIFYGNEPVDSMAKLSKIQFSHYLNPLPVIGVLSQLFIIEQEYGYLSHRESKYDPSSLFYQGWVRQFIDSPREIDIMSMSVCRFQPPKASYTNKENKKHKKYSPNLKALWYCEEDSKLESFLNK